MTWDVTARTTLLQTPHFRVTAAVVESAGRTAQTCYFVEGGDNVVLLARRTDGRLLLVKVSRPTSGATGWELPNSRIEQAEEPQSAAQRLVLDETGRTPGPLKHLGTFLPCNANFTGRAHAYLADDLAEGGDNDPAPGNSVGWFSWDEVLDMVSTGGITDGVSLAALMYLSRKGPL